MSWLTKALEQLNPQTQNTIDESPPVCEKAVIKATEGDEFIEDDQTYPWALINGYIHDSRIIRFIQEEEDI